MGEIRSRLGILLLEREMKLKDLATKVGISETNLSLLKSGKVKAIRFSTLSAICKVLNCQPGDLLTHVPEIQPTLAHLTKCELK